MQHVYVLEAQERSEEEYMRCAYGDYHRAFEGCDAQASSARGWREANGW